MIENDLFAGRLRFEVPISTPKARQLDVAFSLNYDSFAGNGIFGLGFSLDIPSISIKPQRIPRYDGHDQFVLSGAGPLVPATGSSRTLSEAGSSHRVETFRPIREQTFPRIERWSRESDGDVHWRVTDAQDTVSIFGRSGDARIFDPDAPRKVYSWLLEERRDAYGNQVRYDYAPENGDGISSKPAYAGRDRRTQRYPSAVRYGNYATGSATVAWMFQILFDYGQYDFDPANPDPTVPVRDWPVRPDPFSTYRPGFEVRTWRRCRTIAVTHCFPDELGTKPLITRLVKIDYDDDSTQSQIAGLTEIGWRTDADGTVQSLASPPLSLSWSAAPTPAGEFRPLQFEAGSRFGPDIGDTPPRLVDLEGNGTPGLLVSTASELLNWRNLGGGRFSAPTSPPAMPNFRNLGADRARLAPLDRFGRPDMIVETPEIAGYFGNLGNGGWAPFKPFETPSLEVFAPNVNRADLTGAGSSDLLSVTAQTRSWALSAYAKGYTRQRQLANIPAIANPSAPTAKTAVRFANIFGDGLSHLVEIASGSVRVSPNLGYGRFGDPVELDGAPQLPETATPERIFLTDTDGSGTADIVLVLDRELEIYPNLSGNGFGAPRRITLPAPWESIDTVTFGDILATGTNAAIVSLATGETRHFYHDFTGGTKANLVRAIDNGRGGLTEITWRASTEYQIEDARLGRPWITAAPFPVQVVARLVDRDRIADSVTTRCFAYHDAYYDPVLFSFRGFAEVESWDTEVFEGDQEISPTDTRHAPTAYTKSWFINGAYEKQEELQARWHDEFFRGTGNQIALPPAAVELGAASADGSAQRQAWSALAGSLVRSELYGLDGTSDAYLPYEVRQSSWTVRAIQPPTASRLGVFHCARDQQATVVYDRSADDPRTTHELTLARNAIGRPLLEAEIAYPRDDQSDNVLPQQGELLVSANRTDYAAPVDGSRLLTAVASTDRFVCDGMVPDDGPYFTAGGLAGQLQTALADPLMPETPFSGSAPQARWARAERTRYLDPPTRAPLPIGDVASPPLIWRDDMAAFTPGMLEADFSTRLDAAVVEDEGGYQLDDGFWWSVSPRPQFAPAEAFYRVVGEIDPFGTESTARYDAYCLMIVETIDGNGQKSIYRPDYQALAPSVVTDVNGIVAQAVYGPLGDVLATSSFATFDGERQGDGDLADFTPLIPDTKWDVINDPLKYLQNATSYVYRDPKPWSGALDDPPANVTVSRQTFIDGSPSDLMPATTVTYFDGSGRELQEKTRIEGAAVGRGSVSWVSSGRTIYDTKGNVVRAYVPTLQDGAGFKRQPEGVFDSFFYDALGRRIKVLTAKGFLEEKSFTTWTQTASDRDDTVTRSPYYITHIGDTDPDFRFEREALESAAALSDTLTTTHVDPRGETIRIDERLKSASDPEIQCLSTVTVLDRQGRVAAVSDPRFTKHNEDGGAPVFNLRNSYDMGDFAFVAASCDSGTARQFPATDGKIIRSWTPDDDEIATSYTALRQPEAITITPKGGVPRVAETFEYGTDATKNLNERLIAHYDEAGLLSFERYDINGNATQTSRRVLSDVPGTVNWSAVPPPALDDAITIASAYAISGAPLEETGPDGLTITYRYYQTGWLSDQRLLRDGAEIGAMTEFVYSARGERTSSRCANGVLTTRSYEETTGRLLTISTTRLSDSKPLQQISYTYDPVGNLTSIIDNSVNDIVTGHDLVDPDSSYEYDSLYRLIRGESRQAKGIGPRTFHEGFMGTEFLKIPDPNDTSKLVRYAEHYAYDWSGNPVKLVHTTTEGSGNFTRDYAVSQTSNHSVPAELIAGGGTVDDFYDAAGNMIRLTYVPELGWSPRGTLDKTVIVERHGEQPDDVEYHLYDSGLQRVVTVSERLVNGGSAIDRTATITFGKFRIRTRGQVSPKRGRSPKAQATRQVTARVLGGERLNLIAHFWNGSSGDEQEIRYQYPTDLGSVALELDGDAAILSYEEYFPFGGSAFIAGPGKTEVAQKTYRFAGKQRDDATGFYYFGARYYASWLCRWISPDPAGTADGLNLYSYVGNNPISRVDETGLCGVPGKESNEPPKPPPQPSVTALDRVKALTLGGAGSYQGAKGLLELFGVKPVVHAANADVIALIRAKGLMMNAGEGITPKAFPGAVERAAGVNFVTDLMKRGSLLTHAYYSGLKYLQDIGDPSVVKGHLKPHPTFGSLPHMMPYRISLSNTALAFLPYQLWQGAKPDPDSVFKGITATFGGRTVAIPPGVLPWQVGGEKGVIDVVAGFRGRGAVTIPANIPEGLIVGPHFSVGQLVVGAARSIPEYVMANPMMAFRGAMRASLGGSVIVLGYEQLTKDPEDDTTGFDRLKRFFH